MIKIINKRLKITKMIYFLFFYKENSFFFSKKI